MSWYKQNLNKYVKLAIKEDEKDHQKKIKKEMDKIPSSDDMINYVNSLKIYAKQYPEVCKEHMELIDGLPPDKKIRDFSFGECSVLFETIGYLWKKIIGKDLIEEKSMVYAPESLLGNYWLMNNGVLLHGANHFTIIKQNPNIFTHLLNLNGMTMQYYLASKPDKLIHYIIRNGGLRLFVNKDKTSYFQLSPDTYDKWAMRKIKKYDFKKKIVKILDISAPYEGWKSGIVVRL